MPHERAKKVSPPPDEVSRVFGWATQEIPAAGFIPSILDRTPFWETVAAMIRAQGGDPDVLWPAKYDSHDESPIDVPNRYIFEKIPLYKAPVCKDCQKKLLTPYEIKVEQCFGCFGDRKRRETR